MRLGFLFCQLTEYFLSTIQHLRRLSQFRFHCRSHFRANIWITEELFEQNNAISQATHRVARFLQVLAFRSADLFL